MQLKTFGVSRNLTRFYNLLANSANPDISRTFLFSHPNFLCKKSAWGSAGGHWWHTAGGGCFN